MSKRDYYEVLGIAKNSSADEIKKAYRLLASKHHPDKIPGNDNSSEKLKASKKFKEVKEAYETLSDTEKRVHYDMHGHSDPNSFGHGNPQWQHRGNADKAVFEEMFRSMFGSSGNHYTFNENTFGTQSAVHVVNISLDEAYTGKSIRLDSATTIVVPPGARSGSKFFVNNKLYRVDIKPHFKFKRSGDDLLIDISITAIEAMLGIEVLLDHLDGSKLQFVIPKGIQPGQIVKLSNKGMMNPEVDKRGDILVRIAITIPRELSDQSMAALKTVDHREVFDI